MSDEKMSDPNKDVVLAEGQKYMRNTVTGKVYCYEPLGAKREDMSVFIYTAKGEKPIPKALKPKSTGLQKKGPSSFTGGTDQVLDFSTDK